MISPSLERWMAGRAKAYTTELVGSHPIYVSKPKAVATIIKEPARKVSAGS